jgi:hypothetical protein
MQGKRDRRIASFLRRVPKAQAWIDAGFEIQIAAKLLAAGFPSVESIGELSREQFLAKRGLGTGTLEKCEALLGRPLRSLAAYWTEQGLALDTSEALGRAGIDSAEALGKLTREELRAAGVRDDQLEACEALLERGLPEAVKQPTVSETRNRSFLVAAIVPELEAAFGQLLMNLAILQAKRSTLCEEEERLRLSLVKAIGELDAFLSSPPVGLNLTSQSEETESAIYAYLKRTQFSTRLLDGDGNIYIPTHSAEDCELAVYFQYGRWFATWIKPEVDPGQPETLRRELLRFETDGSGRLAATKV